MTKEQLEHLVKLKETILGLVDIKYRKGAKEHSEKDPLLSMNQLELVDNAINENLDQLIYLLTLRDQLK